MKTAADLQVPREGVATVQAMLPCPFCGSEPWGVFGPHPDIGTCWVECHGPDANTCCGDWHFAADATETQAARAEVRSAWNRRALSAPPAAAPGAAGMSKSMVKRMAHAPSVQPTAQSETREREVLRPAWQWMADNETMVFAASESAWKAIMTLIAADARSLLTPTTSPAGGKTEA